MNKLYQEALDIFPKLIGWRRQIHQYAEIGRNLPKTVQTVCDALSEIGIDAHVNIGSGVVAVIGQEGDRRILLRADMDALPMQEESGLPFAAAGNAAHTCGHDMHTAMLLGAAALLKEHESELAGCAVLMFQSDEEGLTGAWNMIEAGVLEPPPDYAVAMHVDPIGASTGQVILKHGALMASCDRFTVTVTGKGGHGAYPDRAVNPIMAANHMVGALTDLGCYEISAMLPSALTVCFFNAGETHNVIPSFCRFGGTLRMLDEEKRAETLKRMKQIVGDIASAYRCKSVFAVESSVPMVRNDDDLVDELYTVLKDAFGEEHILSPRTLTSLGSEDFAHISQRIPSCYLSIGSSPAKCGRSYPLHHPDVVFDEDLIPLGAAVFAQIALYYLSR